MKIYGRELSMTRKKINIVHGMLTVPDSNIQWYEFTIPANAKESMVEGSYTATGGSGNDIEVLLMEEKDFINWKNGHECTVYYQAKLTTDRFKAKLPANRRYCVVFSNRFSAFTSKIVETEVNLSFEV
jgi:hypothetical protein